MFKYLLGFLCLAALLYVASVHAEANVFVERQALGSGNLSNGYEQAHNMPDNLVHVPNYLPGFPTAATIWPRVVTVTCSDDGSVVLCNGYNVNQYSIGRGEYLFAKPVMVATVTAAVVAPVIVKPVEPIAVAAPVIKPVKKYIRKKPILQCK